MLQGYPVLEGLRALRVRQGFQALRELQEPQGPRVFLALWVLWDSLDL